MTVIIGLIGAIVGGTVGVVATYLATRSNMQLSLSHDYDRSLREKRLEYYQALFQISGSITRAWQNAPTIIPESLFALRQDLHAWYFGSGAPGMFLTPSVKRLFVDLVTQLEAVAFDLVTQLEAVAFDQDPELAQVSQPMLKLRSSPLTMEESGGLRSLMSELRHQLAEDVGASHPPHLQWTRPPG